ncbi:MAG: hypothetical protein F4X83_06325 [Chloroflexi bacterium]|nr:hypothetical protein [Chloroflexota bacterium]
MHTVGHRFRKVVGCLVVAALAVACGGDGGIPATGAASGPSVRAGVGTSVDDEEEALAAVQAHLTQITACQAARTRFQEDFARGKFAARRSTRYYLYSQSPVWEVELETDSHIPYVSWYVEQTDGRVLASISAATYYESPLLFMCR